MKRQFVKNRQTGFTLIELVVVIVILGILAATAVPRFADLSTNANQAAAAGVLGAIYGAASIQVGVNQGASSTFAAIMDNLDCSIDSNQTVTVDITANGTGGGDTTCSNANDAQCSTNAANDSTITVTYNGQTATGQISTALCSG